MALAILVSCYFWMAFFAFPLIILADAWNRTNSFMVAMLSVYASFIQLFGYGLGFLKALWVRIVMGKGTFHNFAQSFYD